MAALGESFRIARESQGLSLPDVADSIHIRSAYLAAIETEDWAAIGPTVYVRGFIRNYARFLGLDADAAVAQFGLSSGGAGATSSLRAPAQRGEPARSGMPRGAGGKSGPSPWAILGLLVAIALVAFVGYEYYLFVQSGTPGGAADRAGRLSVAAATPAAVVSAAAGAGLPSSAPTSAPGIHGPAKNAQRSTGLALRLKSSSWLRVVVDGKVTLEGVYPAGTERSFAGRLATVRAGNAAGVDISVGGKDLGPMGGAGDVAERSFHF
jgi:cytoskeletal protein RodZ